MSYLQLRQKLLILVKECGFPAVAESLAGLTQAEAGLINFFQEEQDSLLSKQQLMIGCSHLKQAAVALRDPEPYQLDIPDPIHREAAKRFLERLSPMAFQALGIPPKITVQIQQGELTLTGAKASKGRYEPGDIVQREVLVLLSDDLSHARALELAKETYLRAAKGLFESVAFQWVNEEFRPSWSTPEDAE